MIVQDSNGGQNLCRHISSVTSDGMEGGEQDLGGGEQEGSCIYGARL